MSTEEQHETEAPIAYTVIVENDITKWSDNTGVTYHFPKRYAQHLKAGTRLIHYKGKLRDKTLAHRRLSEEPHYFGMSIAGPQSPDSESDKGDLFLEIKNYVPFRAAVPIRMDDRTLEKIPSTRATNFWRDGVRPTSAEVFQSIAKLAGLFVYDVEFDQAGDLPDGLTTSMIEGGKKVIYSARYERRPELRAKALAAHGSTCFACEISMDVVYGEVAKNFIHIHHRRPISTTGGPTLVDPKTDLVPLCPNCHSIVHLGNKLRSVNDVRSLLGKPPMALGGEE